MNLHAVETLHQEGVTLIITVDNGIASVAEVDRARELGMDVVVTDHHRPPAAHPPGLRRGGRLPAGGPRPL